MQREYALPAHTHYEQWYYDWCKCKIILDGASDDVKRERQCFLPQLPSQNEYSYVNYLERSVFLNAASRARDGFLGAIFAKNPVIKYDSEKGKEDPLKAGNDFINKYIRNKPSYIFLKDVTKKILDLGRCGILVDRPSEVENTSDSVPYVVCYSADNILNWDYDIVNGNEIYLTYVLLATNKTSNIFDPNTGGLQHEEKTEYRVLRLDENGHYVQEIFEEINKAENKEEQNSPFTSANKEKKSFVIEKIATVIPTMNGKPMKKIPFFFINVYDLNPNVTKPPMLDLVDMNIAHFRNSADIERGLHYTALPTPWIAGFNPDTQFLIGSETAWVSENVEAKAGFLEYQGQGLNALKEALNKKESLMAVLSARLLESNRGTESSESQKIRRLGEDSILANISLNVEAGLNKAFHFAGEWDGDKNAENNFSISLNKQYTVTVVKSDVVATMLNALLKGRISMKTWLSYLRNQDLLSPSTSDKSETNDILSDMDTVKQIMDVVC